MRPGGMPGMLAVVLLAAATQAGRPRIAVEGQRDELPPNKALNVPAYVQKFDDESFFKTLGDHDVVLMYLREQHCPDCDFYAEHYFNATKSFGAKGSKVAVGQVDINEEGDLFEDWHGVPEDIPALLVFKAHDTLKYRTKPISFVVNARMLVDLEPFVNRMLGPVHRTLTTESDFTTLIDESKKWSDSLFFVLWSPPDAPSAAAATGKALLERVSELERYNSFYAVVSTAGDYQALVAKYGPEPLPTRPVLVSYATSDADIKIGVFEIPLKGEFKDALKAALGWIRTEKNKRPGHKYDGMLNYYQDDIFVPANYSDPGTEKIGTDKHRYVRARLVGRSSSTKVIVVSRDIEFVTQEDMAMKGIERGIVGMSVGMKRLLVLPPEWRENWKYEPIELHSSSQLLMEVTLLYIGDTNELPGRIEWETDPEKIAAHKKHTEEQERKRQEAIDRGEDPDALNAECKKKEEDKPLGDSA